MEEIILKEYLDGNTHQEGDLMRKLKRFFGNDEYNYNRGMRGELDSTKMNYAGSNYNNMIYGGSINRHSDYQLKEILGELNAQDKHKLMEMLNAPQYSNMRYMQYGFDEHHAKQIVSQMYHIVKDRKFTGEKYDMLKAKEVMSKYQSHLSGASLADVYIAINAQYHDYCELFKEWFGSNIDYKIIESAITFWFKDVDYAGENKVYSYFN